MYNEFISQLHNNKKLLEFWQKVISQLHKLHH